MRRLFIKSVCAILLCQAIVVGIYLVYFEGYKDVTAGRIHREAFDLFQDTDDIHEVRIYRILGEGPSDGVFPIRPYGRDEPTYGSVVLTGHDLQEFLAVWQNQEASYMRQAMCHGAVYGFRLFRKGKATRETSICWECHNFYVTPYPGQSTWYGFNSDSEQAKRLLEFCDNRLPYKRR